MKVYISIYKYIDIYISNKMKLIPKIDWTEYLVYFKSEVLKSSVSVYWFWSWIISPS